MSDMTHTSVPSLSLLANHAFVDLHEEVKNPMSEVMALHKAMKTDGVSSLETDVPDEFMQNLVGYARNGVEHQVLLHDGQSELKRVREEIIAKVHQLERLVGLCRVAHPIFILIATGFIAMNEPSQWLVPVIVSAGLSLAVVFAFTGDPIADLVARRIRQKEAQRNTARTLFLTALEGIIMGLEEQQLRDRIWAAITNPTARRRLGLEKPKPPRGGGGVGGLFGRRRKRSKPQKTDSSRPLEAIATA